MMKEIFTSLLTQYEQGHLAVDEFYNQLAAAEAAQRVEAARAEQQCSVCHHKTHPGAVCQVVVDPEGEICCCDSGLYDAIRYDDKDHPYIYAAES